MIKFFSRWQQVGLVSEDADRARIQFKLSRATQNVTHTELAFLKNTNESSKAEVDIKNRFVLRSHVSYGIFLFYYLFFGSLKLFYRIFQYYAVSIF